MLSLGKRSVLTLLLSMIICGLNEAAVFADDYEPVKSQVEKYGKAADDNARKEIYKKLSRTEPKSREDVESLREVFKSITYDERLFEAATESLRKMHDPSLGGQLIEILKDEKPYMDKVVSKDFRGKSEGERRRRGTNILFIIMNLSQMRSQNAVPILKDYLQYPGFNYYASEALAAIGDKTASDELRERAAKGEDVNYAGQGSDEAQTVIRDLQDKSKKDQWPKIAKQIIHIKDRNAKPYLKQLLNHENMDIRWEAADRFRAMVDENDVPAIIEMTKNSDRIVRAEGIHAMVNLKTFEFSNELIALLNDSAANVRREAAKAIGDKKITRATSALEQTLKDCEQRANSHSAGTLQYNTEISVCNETYITLYILTGKKYDFKGKTTTTEWRAEQQKELLPSINRDAK